MIISSERESSVFLEVNSCARQLLSDRDYTMLRKDGRIDYHILYITHGLCATEINNQSINIGAGNIILFKPYEKQKYSFYAHDHSVSCYIHFSGTECRNLLKQFCLYDNQVTYVGVNNALENIFSEMEYEYMLKREYYSEICASLLLRFLATAGRLAKYHQSTVNLKAQKNMDAVCKYMHTNFQENHNLQFFADMCNLSVGRFSHAFKECTGLSPKAYMTQIKIDNACKLLERTDLNISEVAKVVGIEDVNYFSRIFKQHTGHTPKYYK